MSDMNPQHFKHDDDDDDEFLRIFSKKRRCEAEARRHTIIKVARDDDLLQQIGKDIHFDLVDHGKVPHFRIYKKMPFTKFKEEVAKEFGIPVHLQHYWLFSKRQNHTYRPHRRLTLGEEAQMVSKLRQVSNKANNAELSCSWKSYRSWNSALYHHLAEGRGIYFFSSSFTILRKKSSGHKNVTGANSIAGFDPDEEIELYEEVRSEPRVMCEHLDKGVSFQSSQIENGDIICFQRQLQPHCIKLYRYPDIPSFLEYLKKRQAKPEAAEWVKKPYRHNQKKVEMFGYDRATGDSAMPESEMRQQLGRKDVQSDDSFASNNNTPRRSQSNSQHSAKRSMKSKNDEEQSLKLKESIAVLAGAFKDMVDSKRLPMTGEELWEFIDEMGLDDELATDAFVFLLQRSLHVEGLMATPTGIRKSVLVKMMNAVK